jgi:hypothetical protein
VRLVTSASPSLASIHAAAADVLHALCSLHVHTVPRAQHRHHQTTNCTDLRTQCFPVPPFRSVHARAAVAVAAVSGEEASIASQSVTVLSATPSPAQGVGSHLVLKVPASIDPKAVRASLMASEGVEALVQNRVVRIAQAHGTASEHHSQPCSDMSPAVSNVPVAAVACCWCTIWQGSLYALYVLVAARSLEGLYALLVLLINRSINQLHVFLARGDTCKRIATLKPPVVGSQPAGP